MLGIYGGSKSEKIMIDQGLKENLVSAHHSIKSLLNCNALN